MDVAEHTKEVTQLLSETDSIVTFVHVADWDARATQKVVDIEQEIKYIDAEVSAKEAQIDAAKKERDGKSGLSRMFSSRSAENDAAQAIRLASQKREQLQALADKLGKYVDLTPNSREEQKVMLAELREAKKALQLQKREVAATMREIRNEDKHKAATSIFYSKNMGRWARDAKLRPNETAKAAIERQLIELEKIILWIQRIK